MVVTEDEKIQPKKKIKVVDNITVETTGIRKIPTKNGNGKKPKGCVLTRGSPGVISNV